MRPTSVNTKVSSEASRAAHVQQQDAGYPEYIQWRFRDREAALQPSHLLSLLHLRAMKSAVVRKSCTSSPVSVWLATACRQLSSVAHSRALLAPGKLAPSKSGPGWVITLKRYWRCKGVPPASGVQASATAAAKAGSHTASCRPICRVSAALQRHGPAQVIAQQRRTTGTRGGLLVLWAVLALR